MLTDNFVTMEIGKAKHIALVAHDGKKKELIDWCDRNKEVLQGHFLCGTGTTARLIAGVVLTFAAAQIQAKKLRQSVKSSIFFPASDESPQKRNQRE